MIDEQAGTVTITTSYVGLFEKFSITGGPTVDSLTLGVSRLSMSSSTPGIQTIRWVTVTPSPGRFLGYTGHIPIS